MSVLFFVCSSNTKYGHSNTLACSYLPIVVTMVAAKLKQQHAVVRSIMRSCFLDLLSSLSFTFLTFLLHTHTHTNISLSVCTTISVHYVIIMSSLCGSCGMTMNIIMVGRARRASW